MHSARVIALCLAAIGLCPAQQPAPPAPGLPSDPRAILEAARPFYDFTSDQLKPWHLKVSYQMYDDKEHPTEQGTFEYWWASPEVYRSSWTRGAMSYSRWHLAERGSTHMGAGEALSFAESRLESALLSPLPSTQTADSDTVDLEKRTYGKAPNQFRCVMVGPKMKETNSAPVGLFPTYCFSLTQPALIGYVAYAAPTIEFSHIARTQNRYLPMQITILSPDRKKLLTASVNGVSGISVSDPALTPPTEAKIFYPPKKKAPAVSAEAPAAGASETDKTEDKLDYDATDNHMVIPSGVMQGKALKRPTPIYPDDAKRDRITGKVVIQAVIGTDGWIHDMRVLTTPSASLAASALGAVSQWQYLPYQLNGEPVEVETTVNVVYDIR